MEDSYPTDPEPAVQVHVVRHGEVFNPTGILYGLLPGYHLSENGKAMAARLGECFAPVPLKQLRCSPLERAQETLAPIAAAHPSLEVHTDPRLIEADNKLAGQRFGKRNTAIFDPRNWHYFVNPMKPSWGEPYTELASRMLAAITETAHELPPGAQAVLVSHQLPIWIARLAAEGRRLAHDPRKRQCTLGSVTTFRFTEGRLSGVTYAEPARDLLREDGNKAFSSGH
ncbi:histidine phosphatase family protein [Propionimicrobium sp. PCR01-08-3]|uniref:histidine phosphatase family protein n=1 Tax=Propionimicrobium sp. PCR01-08-3 TaxID=3052086 RepID=UPI00255C5982|nr:histidine phosphatase family protein [Propionimicrobium sp. PCR01-08-3]WIY82037.1 histidine phosphatase family protein [Propionimicrobium sp. PCR01-08-3]